MHIYIYNYNYKYYVYRLRGWEYIDMFFLQMAIQQDFAPDLGSRVARHTWVSDVGDVDAWLWPCDIPAEEFWENDGHGC
jgi:hypothetical protein